MFQGNVNNSGWNYVKHYWQNSPFQSSGALVKYCDICCTAPRLSTSFLFSRYLHSNVTRYSSILKRSHRHSWRIRKRLHLLLWQHFTLITDQNSVAFMPVHTRHGNVKMMKSCCGELSWPSARMTLFSVRARLMLHLTHYSVLTVQRLAQSCYTRLMPPGSNENVLVYSKKICRSHENTGSENDDKELSILLWK